MSSKFPDKPPMGQDATRGAEIGDFICEFLHALLVTDREAFQNVAAEKGLPIESIAAAALCQVMTERGYIS